ncbi:hypothetical protein FHS85_001759 [Rhodoligotrophos appendicifer]|uniref:phage head-tail joining protein n=1 Tax=Rhodoligotrophos appendicifer TaxID=987056 RepID=UPI0011861F99|nr:hypothetical protein [Rhodoligotrophos appendicifer]
MTDLEKAARISWLKSRIGGLDSAIAQGALSVRFGDRQVTYMSLDDLMRARSTYRRELQTLETGCAPAKASQFRFATSKGL